MFTSLLRRGAIASVRARAPRTTTAAVTRALTTTTAVREESAFDDLERTFLPPNEFLSLLSKRRVDFFTGVPDSLLKDFCAYVTDNVPATNHVIAANEGAAIGIAAGYQMASRRYPLVYLQNSGLGNIVNPLLSLTDKKVYSIPMLLMIGWRGEPGRKDEPQHLVQGPITPNLLATMNIPFSILPDYAEGAEEVLDDAMRSLKTRQSPYALLVKKRTFDKYTLQNDVTSTHELTREDFLRIAVEELGEWDVVVATTGFTSRELYELRHDFEHGHERDFLTVGSMGHASAIAAGIAIAKPSRNVWTLDGDGAAIMHMGSLATMGKLALGNYKHVVINNSAHDSVGSQPTGGHDMSFTQIAQACGYTLTITASTDAEIRDAIHAVRAHKGPALLEVRVRPGVRSNLGRPKTSPLQNKEDFIRFLDA